MSNPDTDTLAPYRQRALVLQVTSIVFSIIMMFSVVLNFFITHNYPVGASALIYSSFCIYIYLQIKRDNLKRWYFYGNAIYLTIMMLNSLITVPINSGVIFAFICLPAIYYIFLNFRYATLFTALLFITIVPIIWLKMTTHFTLINFTLVYAAIWTISHLHELTRQKQSEQLEYQATHDPLTGLQNRLALERAIEHLKKSGCQYHLLYIDIDHFKKINDQYSHIAGDGVLQQTAATLHAVSRNSQLYRIGGEEFLCLVLAEDCTDVALLAERVRKTFDDTHYQYHQIDIHYTVSIGVSCSSPDTEFDLTLHLADKALYRAKKLGRNQVCFDEAIDQ